MSAREQANIIAAAVRASLQIAAERGMSVAAVLEQGIDKAIANNAAMALQVEEES